MKKLSTSLLVIFLVVLFTQLVQHTYLRIFQNEESVLEKYRGKKSEISFDKSLSINELSMIYADAIKRIKVAESGKQSKKSRLYAGDDDAYARKTAIEQIIIRKESDNRGVREVLFFWVAGLLLVIAGSIIYLKLETWIGAPVAISGFIEMIWKTGPPFFLNYGGDSPMLLNIKILLTALTIAAVIAFWLRFKRYFER